MSIRADARRPLWAGRTAAILGILLMGLNLRTAVASLSPIIDPISADIPLDSISIGFIGMLPPIAFAASGLLAPLVAKRIGLETALVIAATAMVVGPVLRATAGSYALLVLGTAVTLAGMGFGNILLPPAVKKYFPDRIGLVTAAYATLMSLSAAVPALLAAPVEGAAGWRVSLGVWAIFALSAVVPWVVVRVQRSRQSRADREAGVIDEPRAELVGKIRHSRSAIAITIVFAVSAAHSYAFFGWLPALLQDVAGVSAVEAGALLSLYAIVGLPTALLIPLIASRVRNVGWLIYIGVLLLVIGYLGLLIIPTVATALWVFIAGAGLLIFPLCLVLISLRTRTPETSVALSGFVQCVGYAIGACGPLVVGVVHDMSGGWTAPLLFLIATALLAIVGAVVLTKPRYVEDELAERAER